MISAIVVTGIVAGGWLYLARRVAYLEKMLCLLSDRGRVHGDLISLLARNLPEDTE